MKKKNLLLILIVLLSVSFISTSGLSLAWFSRTKEVSSNSFTPGKMNLSIGTNFDTSSDSNDTTESYVTNGVAILSANDKIYDKDKEGTLDSTKYVDNTNTNAIKNFKVDINVSTSIASVLKVHVNFNTILEKRSYDTGNVLGTVTSIFEESVTKRFNPDASLTTPEGGETPWDSSSCKWTFDEVNNTFFYNDVITKDYDGTLSFIGSGNPIEVNTKLTLYYQNYICNCNIKVEMVQVNRYLALWGENSSYPSSWPKETSN